jgi:hypothetical protein
MNEKVFSGNFLKVKSVVCVGDLVYEQIEKGRRGWGVEKRKINKLTTR